MKCKSWSNKINNFVVRRLKSIKINSPQHQLTQQQQQHPLPTTSTTTATTTVACATSVNSSQQQQQTSSTPPSQLQYLSNCCSSTMPAMPKEKATAVSLTENNFSELKLKEMATTATATMPNATTAATSCRQQNATAQHHHHQHHQHQHQQQRNLCGCGNASAPEVNMRTKFMTNGHSSPLTAAMAAQNSSPSSSPQRLSTASTASSASSNTTCCRLRYQQQQQTNGGGATSESAMLLTTTTSSSSMAAPVPAPPSALASSQTSTSSSSVGSFAMSSVSSTTNSTANLYPARASPPAANAITPPKKSPRDYIFGKYIGEGSFSMVYLAVDIYTKREYAIKVCEKRQILREHKQEYIRREREVMHTLTNVPGFVNLSCTFQDNRSLYFVMTYAKNGDLLPYINKVGSFDVDSTRHYAAELVLACEQMHRRNIVHRDLKPENILLDEDMHTLIADFGSVKMLSAEEKAQANAFLLSGGTDLAKKARCQSGGSMRSDDDEYGDDDDEDYESTGSSGSCGDGEVGGYNDSPLPVRQQPPRYRRRRGSFVGTAQYVSPEVLLNAPITPAADLWALGCIIYQMMSGLPPFRGSNDYVIFKEIIACNLDFPQGFDRDAEDLVKKLLKLNPAERLGAQDIAGHYESIRSHPFFKDVDFEAVRQTTPPPISPFLPDLVRPEEEEFMLCENLEPGLDEKQLTRLLGKELGCISDDDSERKMSVNKAKPAITTTPASTPNNLQKSAKNSFDLSDIEKHKRLELQKTDKWHVFADGEVILKNGFVNKRKGLFARRRMLLLTTGPRLIYIDPVQMVKKGEIPWSPELRAEAKNFKIFFVHTPNRTYYLDDPEGFGLEWVAAIEKMHLLTYNTEHSNNTSNSNTAAGIVASSSSTSSSCSSNSNNRMALNLNNNNTTNNNNHNHSHSHSTSSVTKTSSAISASSIAHKTSSLLATPFTIMKTASN